jgi:hypothetical protein
MKRLLLLLLASPAAAFPSSYASVDAAAVGFVDLVRSYPGQKIEYCAWLIKGKDGKIVIDTIKEGDMDRCPSSWPKPAGTVGSVHTHPIWGTQALEAAGQVFSEGDFTHAEHESVGVPTYLGAPAGHVLRYDPGGSSCWGSSFIARKFKVVRDVAPGVAGRLQINSGEKVPLFDLSGKPIPKPAYCKDGRS